ncbi:MAG TPA: hypothetical protein VF916_11410 [Ktedonobacterales bacterium]
MILQDPVQSAAINTTAQAANVLQVQATGPHFVLSVNGTVVGRVTDDSFAVGDFGLSTFGDVEAVFTRFVAKAG